ncbi:MAG TPA: carbamoyltransferase HypF [Polyangia bacterium]|jgi:hydrogenase maturation protein HypF|nr:carbamoyltransferase HypF [Polyangia bacterium]
MAVLAQLGSRVRRSLRVRGTVQGVGFRPAVCRFATGLALGGFVRNDEQGVLIEIEGGADAVGRFVSELPATAPPLAWIESLEATALDPVGERTFRIAPSQVGDAETRASIPADCAPCVDCLRELHDPNDRRHRYPFINCTACGPRFTIVRSTPYDRSRTTMAAFGLCEACRAEYEDPRDRRFHAEPNACPLCGPTVTLVRPGAAHETGEPALAATARLLSEGSIVAVKGAGGFLLAVDASDARAVARLRLRKCRPAKPLAVMAASLEELERVAIINEAERSALLSPARPIVIVRRSGSGSVAANVAPGLLELGVCLPPTPLQQLLVEDGPRLLVMTSGNRSEEPIARDNREAELRLGAIADAFLVHDRDVHTRADDSVVRVVAGHAAVLRRARGYVPQSIALPFEGPPTLAVGAELKTAICLTRNGEAILSQHIGDLHDAEGFAFFTETVDKLIDLTGATPRAVVHDLHPDYRSTRWARSWARQRGIHCQAVQHHHAHVASCLIENGRTAPALGVAFDGTGFGLDGTLWGGEIMLADLAGFRRLAHLRPLRLLGGEAAVRQPWRLAAAALFDAGEGSDLCGAGGPGRMAAARALWERPKFSPSATGAGRWFDAVAALCGLRSETSYDGQAAIELEALAAADDHPPYEFSLEPSSEGPSVVDLRPTVRAIAADLRGGVGPSVVAARFHATLARAIGASCARAREMGAPTTVALSGGCFQNRRLTELATAELHGQGFEVLVQRRVPCNDGGLALGQAAIAAFRAGLSHLPEVARPCA